MIEKTTKTLEQEFREIKRDIETLSYETALKHLKGFNISNVCSEKFDYNVGFFCITVSNRNGMCHVSNSVEIYIGETDVKQYTFPNKKVHPSKLKQGDLFQFSFASETHEFISLSYYQGKTPIVTCIDYSNGKLQAYCCVNDVELI